MTRELYYHMDHSLRKLLHKFNEEDEFLRAVQYSFGLQFNRRFGFYHLWDYNLNSSVATIKVLSDKVITRYLEGWNFEHRLLNLRVDGLDPVFVPSVNVQRHDPWVRQRVHHRCEQAVSRYHAEQRVAPEVDGEYYMAFSIEDTRLGTVRNIAIRFDSETRASEEVSRTSGVLHEIERLGQLELVGQSVRFSTLLSIYAEVIEHERRTPRVAEFRPQAWSRDVVAFRSDTYRGQSVSPGAVWQTTTTSSTEAFSPLRSIQERVAREMREEEAQVGHRQGGLSDRMIQEMYEGMSDVQEN